MVKIGCSELKNHGNVKKWQTPLALFEDVKRFCKEILELLNEYKLPSVKPKWEDFTDASPGVGVSNKKEKFREADITRIFNSHYRATISDFLNGTLRPPLPPKSRMQNGAFFSSRDFNIDFGGG